MKLTDYYKLAKLASSKSKNRFDCTASTGSYEPIEQIGWGKKGWNGIKFYLTDVPQTFNGHAKRRATKALTTGKNFSSVYIPNLDFPLYGFGDTFRTQDGLLFLFNEEFSELEIFVARGLKNSIHALFDLFLDGELEEEINNLRKLAKPVN